MLVLIPAAFASNGQMSIQCGPMGMAGLVRSNAANGTDECGGLDRAMTMAARVRVRPFVQVRSAPGKFFSGLGLVDVLMSS
jgi:hypothetical protein